MSKIFVSGLVNVETSLKVKEFPIEYSPIEYPFFGVNTSVSGVGYNVAKALTVLEDDIDLFSVMGIDNNSELIKTQLKKDNIGLDNIQFNQVAKTAESVILYDEQGRRKVYCDLKNLQEIIPFIDIDIKNPKQYELAILTNINFSRPLIKVFKDSGVPIASDVHVLTNIHDEYNKDFMTNSDFLFLSNEGCMGRESEFIQEVYKTYHNKIIVIGCGSEGTLVYIGEEDRFIHEKAVAPLGVNNTVGAGDALFSAFIHFYQKTKNIEKSLRFAVIFAGIKVSSSGGAEGFVDEKTVLKYL